MTTIAGGKEAAFADGIGSNASFLSPTSLLVCADGQHLLVADGWNHRIRLIDTTTSLVTTIAGSGQHQSSDGSALEAGLFDLRQMVMDARRSDVVYITADYALRKLTFDFGRQ